MAGASQTAAKTPSPSGPAPSTPPIPPPASRGRTATFTSGVASGDVTSTSALLWTRADGGDAVEVDIATDATFASGLRSETAHTSAGRDFTVKANMRDLQPGTVYHYRFRAGDAVSPVGAFATATDASVSQPLRFVFAGDSDGTRRADGTPAYNNFEVLDAAAAEHPAFFLYFGDTIYGDRPPVATTLDGYRAKYRQIRGYPALTNLLAQTSTYNTWDDHEVVNDFAGNTVDRAVLDAGRQAFREYMPIDDSAGDPATMYRAFRWGKDVDLIVLDERGFRDGSAAPACTSGASPDPLPRVLAPGAPEFFRAGRGLLGLPPELPPGCLATLSDPSRTLLGPGQTEFLKQRLAASGATWKVIVNEVPVQQLLVQPYDRWEGYAGERRELLRFIDESGVKNVVFLTTDFHATIFGPVRVDLFTDPAPVAYEAVVGPIATSPLRREITEAVGETAADAFGALLSGVIQVDCSEIESYAYGLVEVDPASGTLTITSKDATGRELCKKQLKAE